jgi:hypothetical protein
MDLTIRVLAALLVILMLKVKICGFNLDHPLGCLSPGDNLLNGSVPTSEACTGLLFLDLREMSIQRFKAAFSDG